jgi:hypothetical protein
VYASQATRIGRETFIYFLLLGVYNVIFFMGAYLAFLRYEV